MIILQASLIFIILLMLRVYEVFMEKIISQRIYSKVYSIKFIFAFIVFTKILFLRYNNIDLILLDIGVFLNMVVIVSNNGYMPVDMIAFKRAVSLYEPNPSDRTVQKKFKDWVLPIRQYVAMDNNTKFNILGDRYGSSIQSIGDMFIRIGGLLIIIEIVLHIFKII